MGSYPDAVIPLTRQMDALAKEVISNIAQLTSLMTRISSMYDENLVASSEIQKFEEQEVDTIMDHMREMEKLVDDFWYGW